MTQQAESSIVDVFKERLASPFLFTFFWVSCTWNWKIIYWFLYEPLKPSIKFNKVPFEWGVFCPALIAVVIIAVVPWLNNAVEIIKQYAAHQLNIWLHKLNWKKMVTEAEYQKLVDEITQLKEKQHKLINDNVAAQENENQAKENLLSSQKEVNSYMKDLSELEEVKKELLDKISDSESKMNILDVRFASANDKLEDIKTVSIEQIKMLESARSQFHGPSLDLANSFHDGHSKIIKLIEHTHHNEAVMQHFIGKELEKEK